MVAGYSIDISYPIVLKKIEIRRRGSVNIRPLTLSLCHGMAITLILYLMATRLLFYDRKSLIDPFSYLVSLLYNV